MANQPTNKPVRYTYRWGFVYRVKDEDYFKEWTYIYRWGFVWRKLRSETYRHTFVTGQQRIYQWRPGGIIDINDISDFVAMGIQPVFLKKKLDIRFES